MCNDGRERGAMQPAAEPTKRLVDSIPIAMHDLPGSPGGKLVFKRLVVLAACVLSPGLCLSDPKGLANETPVVAQKLDAFEREASAVREGMQAGGVYSYISEPDKARVEQRLDAMHKLLEDQASQSDLSTQNKVALMNDEEAVNALLLQNDNNRLECEHGARTGSRIHVTTCRTHGELMKRQQQDHDAMAEVLRKPQTQLPSKDH